MRRFRGFETWEAPTGEVWRLYSERREIGNRGVEIMVGQSVKGDWDLVNRPSSPEVDAALKQEVDRVASRVIVEGGRVESRRVNSRADGWQVVEANTGRVVRWNGQIPAVFPKDRRLGAERIGLYREGGDILVVRADENDDILAVSVAHVGDLWWLLVAIGAAGALAFLLAYVVGVEWLRYQGGVSRAVGGTGHPLSAPSLGSIAEKGSPMLQGYGPRVAESGLGLIADYPWSAPYEDLKLR